MVSLRIERSDPPVHHVLCLGAHSDDIEVGCGGTMLSLIDKGSPLIVTWVVFSANPSRKREARTSAGVLLRRVKTKSVLIQTFRDGFFPYTASSIKEYFEELKEALSPDVIFTHHRNDLHQDHRLISELTWNTFRTHLILEYEIPKYDGDLGSPNVFVHLDEARCRRKVRHILATFKTQRNKGWFSEEVLLSLPRLRGMESNAPGGYAEAFYCRKLVLA